MKYAIGQKKGKYFKKYKLSGLDVFAGAVVALAVVYIIFQLLRG